MRRTANVAQLTVVSLLVWAAYWAALPWIGLYVAAAIWFSIRRP
jgi:hypothetical protein